MSFVENFDFLPPLTPEQEEEERRKKEQRDRDILIAALVEQEQQTGQVSPLRAEIQRADEGQTQVFELQQLDTGEQFYAPVQGVRPGTPDISFPEGGTVSRLQDSESKQFVPDISDLLSGYDKPVTPRQEPIVRPQQLPSTQLSEVATEFLAEPFRRINRGAQAGASAQEVQDAAFTALTLGLGGPATAAARPLVEGASRLALPNDFGEMGDFVSGLNPIGTAKAEGAEGGQTRQNARRRRERAQQIEEERLNAEGYRTNPSTGEVEPIPDEPVSVTHTDTVERGHMMNKPRTPMILVETAGGRTTVSPSEYGIATTLGVASVAAMGSAFLPPIYRKLKLGHVPKLRSIRDAAPGTVSGFRADDLARAYDDVNAPLLRYARRMGADPVAMQQLEQLANFQTRGQASSIVDAAITSGRAETIGFNFQSATPLAELMRLERASPQITRYMHLLDTADELREVRAMNRRRIAAGRPTQPEIVRQQNLPTINTILRNMERQNPALRQFADQYRDVLRNVRRFESDGEYATLRTHAPNLASNHTRNTSYLNRARQNEVPMRGGRVTGENVDRGPATSSLAEAMHTRMRDRMENEFKGAYVDLMRRLHPGHFRPVTEADLKANPHWRKKVVEIYRRGEKEMYTSDGTVARLMQMDPYIMDVISGALYQSKRFFESTTTGLLQPFFAPISMIRNHLIQKTTTPGWRRSATIAHTLAAIPQQVLPQLARAISGSLERANGGWIDQVFGPVYRQQLANWLSTQYMQSFYRTLEVAGGSRSSVIQQQRVQSAAGTALQQMRDVTEQVAPAFRTAWRGYQAFIASIHEAPSFANTRILNRVAPGLTNAELALNARQIVGDPRRGGQFRGIGGIDTDMNSLAGVTHTLASKLVQTYGFATEVGRTAVPWWNVTTQGIKRIGQAYLNNPVEFTAKMWAYVMMPAASTYMWNRWIDKDPNGVSYVDHQMNQRSPYDKMMTWYIGIPGRPVEDGIRIPIYHETSIISWLTQASLDHMYRSNVFTESEDFGQAFKNFIGIAAEPPMPPLANLLLATQGLAPGQGSFTGEAYRRRVDPYDQTGGLPVSIELSLRAIAPSIAEVVGAGYAAFTQTPDNADKAMGNAMTSVGKRLASRVPVVRDVLGTLPPMTGNTQVSEYVFGKQRHINNLVRYFNEWTGAGGDVNVKPASAAGGEIVEEMLGRLPRTPQMTNSEEYSTYIGQPHAGYATSNMGLNQPPPTNPQYREFMQRVRNRFVKDKPEWSEDEEGNIGGMGYRSAWRRYGDTTKQIQRLSKVNDGNFVTWQAALREDPSLIPWLKENNVDVANPRSVRNFIEHQRQNALRVITHMIKSVENEMGIKIEQLDPYAKPRGYRPNVVDIFNPLDEVIPNYQ